MNKKDRDNESFFSKNSGDFSSEGINYDEAHKRFVKARKKSSYIKLLTIFFAVIILTLIFLLLFWGKHI